MANKELQATKTHAVVKYDNGLNSTALRDFSPVEMDIFWAILSKMKNKGTAEVTFDFADFKRLAKYDRREKDGFYDALKSMSNKLGTLNYKFEDTNIFEQLWLFSMFRIDKEEERVTIRANESFEFILNSIGKNFTRFELDNFTKLKSSYVKELYRHLMQFRNKETGSGYWIVKIEDFKYALSIPKSYRMTHINTRILDKAKEEFTSVDEDGTAIFEEFSYEKIRAKKGNKIDRIKISFKEPEIIKVSLYNWLEG